MEISKLIETPMSTSCNLDKHGDGKPVDESKYQVMIRYLLYLTVSYPDIVFFVCMRTQFQASSKESHLSAVKRIMRYLSVTQQIGLSYLKGENCSLVRYSKSSFSGCILERKGTIYMYHLLENSLVSWHSKKKASVTLSTIEEKYVVTSNYFSQVI